MNFEYEGSGTVQICGKAKVRHTVFVFTTYGPGDIVFSRKKALNGKLERVCIKKVTLNPNPRDCAYAGAGIYPMYTDTLNGIWFDEDIVDQDTALLFINFYIESQHQLLMDIECN